MITNGIFHTVILIHLLNMSADGQEYDSGSFEKNQQISYTVILNKILKNG